MIWTARATSPAVSSCRSTSRPPSIVCDLGLVGAQPAATATAAKSVTAQTRSRAGMRSNAADVVGIDRARALRRCDLSAEAILDEAHDTRVHMLARLVAHHEKRRRLDAES